MKNVVSMIIIVLLFVEATRAQGGVITFNRKHNWANIATKLPYLSQEEKDRILLVWGSDNENKGENYLLTFNQEGSIFEKKPAEENYGYRWSDDEEDDILIRDTKMKTTKDIRILLGKKYLIEDDIPRFKWKILNELKDVAGFVCMKAETMDTVNNVVIHAWFTDKIAAGGPEGFSGLPGMILAVDYNIDDINIVATKVELKEESPALPLPKKIKGKPLSYEEYNAKKKKYIQLSVEGKRNPYWEIRY